MQAQQRAVDATGGASPWQVPQLGGARAILCDYHCLLQDALLRGGCCRLGRRAFCRRLGRRIVQGEELAEAAEANAIIIIVVWLAAGWRPLLSADCLL